MISHWPVSVREAKHLNRMTIRKKKSLDLLNFDVVRTCGQEQSSDAANILKHYCCFWSTSVFKGLYYTFSFDLLFHHCFTTSSLSPAAAADVAATRTKTAHTRPWVVHSL